MSKSGLIKVVRGGVEVSGVCVTGGGLGGKDCDFVVWTKIVFFEDLVCA